MPHETLADNGDHVDFFTAHRCRGVFWLDEISALLLEPASIETEEVGDLDDTVVRPAHLPTGPRLAYKRHYRVTQASMHDELFATEEDERARVDIHARGALAPN